MDGSCVGGCKCHLHFRGCFGWGVSPARGCCSLAGPGAAGLGLAPRLWCVPAPFCFLCVFTASLQANRGFASLKCCGRRPKNRQKWQVPLTAVRLVGNVTVASFFQGLIASYEHADPKYEMKGQFHYGCRFDAFFLMSEFDIFVSSAGNFNFGTLDHVKKLTNNAFVGNTGHFDNEIDLAGSEGLEGLKVDNIEPPKCFSSSPLATA